MVTVTFTQEQIQRIMKALADDQNKDSDSLTLHSYLHEVLKKNRK